MTINSEPIYDAVFTLVKAAYPFVTAQRRLRYASDLTVADMPAAFQIQMNDATSPDTEAQQYGLKATAKDELLVHIMVFAHSGTTNQWPSSIINPIVDAIKAQFSVIRRPGGDVYQNLGGLVEYALVSGNIPFHETAKSDSILAIIPIKILAFN